MRLSLHRFGLEPSRWPSALAGLALLAGLVPGAYEVRADVFGRSLNDELINNEIAALHQGEKSGMAPLQMGRLWAQLASDYQDGQAFSKAEDAYNHALRLLQASSTERVDYAVVLDNLGSLYDMMGNYGASERCRKHALELRVKLGDQLEIARGRAHLAGVYLGMHKYKDARREALEAYNAMVALHNQDTGNIVNALFTLSYAACRRDGCSESLEYARKAWTLASGAFPADSLPIGLAHMALGYAEWKAEMKDGPDEEMRKGIEIVKARPREGASYLLSSLEQYRTYLASVHREPDANVIAQQETQLQGPQPTACANCTVSVYGLRGRP